jgi:cytidylate kinase
VEKKLIITIDGPAGSGKSTTAKVLAEKMRYTYLDTGAMYRAITLKVLQEKVDTTNTSQIAALLPKISVRLHYENGKQKTILNGIDVSEAIRSRDVTQYVSAVSSIRDVRQFLVKQQREIGESGGYVIDGRDAGTVIFPDADVKFFLTADVGERARRRMLEWGEKSDARLEKTIDEIRQRDSYDENREESPLRKPDDGVEIDNTHMTIDEQVQLMLTHIKRKLKEA